MAENNPSPGLGTADASSWPKGKALLKPGQNLPDFLTPGSDQHNLVKDYLLDRLNESENAMGKFYSRWRTQEMKVQAYIQLPDYEKALDLMNKENKPPQVVSIIVPYGFAVISTIVTYLLHTFCGRKPILQVGSYKGAKTKASENMELVLQYQADHTRLVKHIWQFLQDTQVYGLGVMRAQWVTKKAKRTKIKQIPKFSFWGQSAGSTSTRVRELTTTYAGNEVESIDPFMFFPDTRVPMVEVNTKGEYVFWRSYKGRHWLKSGEEQGLFAHVDRISDKLPVNRYADMAQDSGRALKSEGEAFPGRDASARLKNYVQIDEGTVDIIPKELGLGDSKYPEKWLFTLANKEVIIRAEKFECDHGKHPVVVSEPYQLGHGFGNPGMSDYVAPLQDLISWMINSHMANVRTAINNMFVVDPSMVEMQDLKNPGDGKIIRLKRAAYGMDVRMALSQLQVQDVTVGHVKDVEVLMRFGQQMTGVVDNLLGLQDSGGRKTATEVRTSGEAAASRLAATGRVISAQGIVDLAEIMTLNTQQFMDEAIELALLGEGKDSVKIGPAELSGDYYFPINDGALPLDKVAMLEVWKEILLGVAKDPVLRQTFDITKIFTYVAELGGARNIESFKVQVLPNNQVMDMAAAGQIAPPPAPLTSMAA